MSSRKYTDQSLKALIQEMLKNTGMDKKYSELDIVECYYKVVGKVIASKTLAVKVNDKTLSIKLENSVLKQELSLQKSKLIQLINEELGIPSIEEIIIR